MEAPHSPNCNLYITSFKLYTSPHLKYIGRHCSLCCELSRNSPPRQEMTSGHTKGCLFMYSDLPLWASLLFTLFGLWLLAWSANKFVDGSATLAKKLGVAPFIIGMVIIGFGTSAPEMAVSALSAASGHADISIGNAYGSNIYNIAIILGVVALVRPIATRSSTALASSALLVLISVLAGVLVWRGGMVSRIDALMHLILFALLLPLSCWLERATGSKDDNNGSQEINMVSHPWLWAVGGLGLLILSSHLLVWGAVDLAREMGISELMIGLTIVAAGTSLPELASAIVSARKGQHDFVLGNIVGSNFFNTLAVVGLSGTIQPFTIQSPYVLNRDLPVMILLSLTIAFFGCGRGIYRGNGRIGWIKGSLWILLFIAYMIVLGIQESTK